MVKKPSPLYALRNLQQKMRSNTQKFLFATEKYLLLIDIKTNDTTCLEFEKLNFFHKISKIMWYFLKLELFQLEPLVERHVEIKLSPLIFKEL